MTHRDRAGDPPGRRKAAGDAGHRQGFPTPSGGSPARPERRFPKAFGRRRAWLAMPASPRHALLAENLGKPSLWVIIDAPWYEPRAMTGTHRKGPAQASTGRERDFERLTVCPPYSAARRRRAIDIPSRTAGWVITAGRTITAGRAGTPYSPGASSVWGRRMPSHLGLAMFST